MRLPVFLTLALGSATAWAQATITNPAPAPACAVGLYAQQRSAGVTVWTTALEDVEHPPQGRSPQDKRGLHVVVTPHEGTIREVTLRVTYLPYGLRALPADTMTKQDLREQSKTFTLHAGDAAGKKIAGDLLLGLVSGVKSVALESIVYADGSSWKAPAVNPCSVAPSGYVPVTATAP